MNGRTRGTIVDSPPSRPFQILELTILERPQERCQTEQTKEQGNRNKPRERCHASISFDWPTGARNDRGMERNRNALLVTMMEDVDMAIAASSGVT